MTDAELAEQLRERLRIKKLVPLDIIESTSDFDMIDSYITCSCCGEKQVDEHELRGAIKAATSAGHFMDICDAVAATKSNPTAAYPRRARRGRRGHA